MKNAQVLYILVLHIKVKGDLDSIFIPFLQLASPLVITRAPQQYSFLSSLTSPSLLLTTMLQMMRLRCSGVLATYVTGQWVPTLITK